MRFLKTAILASTVISSSLSLANADVSVVTSIKPVHSLAAAVMEGVGKPNLLVEGTGSPHTYALKPSQAQLLQDADLIFWVGHDLEAFLEDAIDNIAQHATAVSLFDSHGLIKIAFREGGAFDAHDHDDHDEHGHDDHDDHKHDDHDEHGHDDHDDHKHDDHDEHGHDDHDDHKHDDHDEHGHDDHDDHKHDDHDEHGHDDHDDHKHDDHDEHGHDDHDDHEHDDHDDHGDAGHDDHGEFDVHFWLDPKNAKAMVHEIEENLSKVDPKNAQIYASNADALMAKLDALIVEVNAELTPVSGKGYIVFHDAYQYFEYRFGVSAVGSITVSPEVMPGAERIRTIQEKVKSLDATCVFSEPQFEPKLVDTIIQGTTARSGVLDPLGATIEDGPELYFTLIRNMAKSLKECLVS